MSEMTMLKNKTKLYPLNICNYGITDYKKMLKIQHQLRDDRRNEKIPNTIILVEHNPVITLGARKSANKLLFNPEYLKQKRIDIVETRRGGGITAHNPGQLVIYPIFHMGQIKLGISEYIMLLQKIGIKLLQQLGVCSQIRKGFPGLWVGERKIASIGVRVSRLITYHGMAVNIWNELDIFDFFVPCGLKDVEMTSVYKETGQKVDMQNVKKILSELFIKYLSSKELTTYENCA